MSQSRIRRRAGWSIVRRIWASIYYPQVFTVLTCAAYILMASGWIPGLVDPPSSLQGAFGAFSMYMIASLITIGCSIGIPAAIWGQDEVERWSIFAVIGGVAMYVFIIHVLHWTNEGNRLPQAQTIAALVPLFGVRLWWVVTDPMKIRRGKIAPDKDVNAEEV